MLVEIRPTNASLRTARLRRGITDAALQAQSPYTGESGVGLVRLALLVPAHLVRSTVARCAYSLTRRTTWQVAQYKILSQPASLDGPIEDRRLGKQYDLVATTVTSDRGSALEAADALIARELSAGASVVRFPA